MAFAARLAAARDAAVRAPSRVAGPSRGDAGAESAWVVPREGAPTPPLAHPPRSVYVRTIETGSVYGDRDARSAVVAARGTPAAALCAAAPAMDAHAPACHARWAAGRGGGFPVATIVTDPAAVVDGAALIDIVDADGDYTRVRVWVCAVPATPPAPRGGGEGGVEAAGPAGRRRRARRPLYVLTREAAQADRLQRCWVEAVALSVDGVGAAATHLLRRHADWGPAPARAAKTGPAAAAAIARRVRDRAVVASSCMVWRDPRSGAEEPGAHCRLRVQVLWGGGEPGGDTWAATLPRRVVASVLDAQQWEW